MRKNPRYAHRTRPSSIVPRLVFDLPDVPEVPDVEDQYDKLEFFESLIQEPIPERDEPLFPATPVHNQKKSRRKQKLEDLIEFSSDEEVSDVEQPSEERAVEKQSEENEYDAEIKRLQSEFDDDENFSLHIEDADGNILVLNNGLLKKASDEDMKRKERRKEKNDVKSAAVENVDEPLSSQKSSPQNNDSIEPVIPTTVDKPKSSKSRNTRSKSSRPKSVVAAEALGILRHSIMTTAKRVTVGKSRIVCSPARVSRISVANAKQVKVFTSNAETPIRNVKKVRDSLNLPMLSPIRRDSQLFDNFPALKNTVSKLMPQMCSTPVQDKDSGAISRNVNSVRLSIPAFDETMNEALDPTVSDINSDITQSSSKHESGVCSPSTQNTKMPEQTLCVSEIIPFDNTQSSSRSNDTTNTRKAVSETNASNDEVFKTPLIDNSVTKSRLRRSKSQRSSSATQFDSTRKRKTSSDDNYSTDNTQASENPSDMSKERSVTSNVIEEKIENTSIKLDDFALTSFGNSMEEKENQEICNFTETAVTFNNYNTLMLGDNGTEMNLGNTTNRPVFNNMTNMTMASEYGKNATLLKRNVTLIRADSTLNGSRIFPNIPFYLDNYAGDNSSLSQLLHIIDQDQIIGWNDLPKEMLEKPLKLGEGAYGEVFRTSFERRPTALKIMPISAEATENRLVVNGEFIFTAEEVLPEVLITKLLSGLNNMNNQFSTPNFIELLHTRIVRGKYPLGFLKAFDKFAKNNETYNDRPSEYHTDDQLFLILGLSLGGGDLEKQIVTNEKQFISLFFQLVLTLTIAEKTLEFEHRDLHLGNLLLEKCNNKEKLQYKFDGNDFCLCTHGVKIKIIDFTLSRLKKDGITLYKDLESDAELFEGKGLYQYDIYRMMRKENKGEWSDFEPKTNLFWLHHLAFELLTKQNCPKITKKRKQELMLEMDKLLTLESVTDILTNENFTWMVQNVLEKV